MVPKQGATRLRVLTRCTGCFHLHFFRRYGKIPPYKSGGIFPGLFRNGGCLGRILEVGNLELHESGEDYLEAILMLKERNGVVRSIDIANELNFTKPSISVAMKRLRENGFIEMDRDSHITLTDKGYEIANNIYTRHKVLTSVLVALGVEEHIAAEDACKIEHDLSEESFEAIRRHAESRKQG